MRARSGVTSVVLYPRPRGGSDGLLVRRNNGMWVYNSKWWLPAFRATNDSCGTEDQKQSPLNQSETGVKSAAYKYVLDVFSLPALCQVYLVIETSEERSKHQAESQSWFSRDRAQSLDWLFAKRGVRHVSRIRCVSKESMTTLLVLALILCFLKDDGRDKEETRSCCFVFNFSKVGNVEDNGSGIGGGGEDKSQELCK